MKDQTSTSTAGKRSLDERFVLGVDLDGVCADFYEGLRPIAAEWLQVPLESLTKEVSWGLKEWGVQDAPGGYNALHRFAVTQRDLFVNLAPMDGVGPVLRRLTRRRIRVRIITHRLFIRHFHQVAVRQTIEWLDYHDIPYWDLCFMKDKAAIGADLYVDDSPDHVRALRLGGHKVVVFGNSTNRDLAHPRASNWIGIEQIVEGELEYWKYPGQALLNISLYPRSEESSEE
jgi:5'(3')-deoxyribonucleotidase